MKAGNQDVKDLNNIFEYHPGHKIIFNLNTLISIIEEKTNLVFSIFIILDKINILIKKFNIIYETY